MRAGSAGNQKPQAEQPLTGARGERALRAAEPLRRLGLGAAGVFFLSHLSLESDSSE